MHNPSPRAAPPHTHAALNHHHPPPPPHLPHPTRTHTHTHSRLPTPTLSYRYKHTQKNNTHPPPCRYCKLELEFEDGTQLAFCDPRRFAKVGGGAPRVGAPAGRSSGSASRLAHCWEPQSWAALAALLHLQTACCLPGEEQRWPTTHHAVPPCCAMLCHAVAPTLSPHPLQVRFLDAPEARPPISELGWVGG